MKKSLLTVAALTLSIAAADFAYAKG